MAESDNVKGANPSLSATPASAAAVSVNKYTLQGTLTFDNGLPAAGITTRLYKVVFGGNDVKLGETTSGAPGNYSISYEYATGSSPSVQVRVVNSANQEVTISATKFNSQTSETLNLVVPSSVQPLAPEFQRLSADMQKSIGGVANLAQAQENSTRQDFTLLNQSTNWDARLVALAASAAQQTAATGLGQDVLYALFRFGLPINQSLLAMVPAASVQAALTKANQSGIVSLNSQQIAAATTTFQQFASKTQLAMIAPGTASSYQDMLSLSSLGAQQAAFANLYFSNPAADDLWAQAAKLNIPAQTLSTLMLQGKCLYLARNSAKVAQEIQRIVGASTDLSQLADKDFDLAATWQNTLNSLGGNDQGVQSLIPPMYTGNTTADRLAAYSGALALAVEKSYSTRATARKIERGDLPLNPKTAPNVTSFLRAAGPLGYKPGQTPLHIFINKSGKSLPALDADSTASLETLVRLYQVTPSTESLQVAMKLGFTSARDIASYTKDEFMEKYATSFPPGEASLVYWRSQTISSVTFNVFTSAKQLDNLPAVYGVAGSDDAREQAKNSIVQQFPTMSTLFGNMDYCQCEDCRSVLSPAAYFVDILEFLNSSPANPAGYTPLDVLIGKDATVIGRRPDLGALPLTCENTNTAMPYIDLVNEILEYYIAHNNKLDTNLAYDTGTATTAELTAEPENILPQVYTNTLKQAVFPLNLPFDLWIETVRGFLNYFQSPLAQVLDTLRPVDNLELFTDTNLLPYYRAQTLAESLGLSPSEYAVVTDTDPKRQPLAQHWFELYGYTSEANALHGVPDPLNPGEYQIQPLSVAENLSQLLGISYQDLTNLLKTGFLNPKLYPLIFQFERFGISMSDAFSYTGQPGYPALSNVPAFEASLQTITNQYKTQNPSTTFQAKTWLQGSLPTNYSKGVLVLATPSSGCDFNATTLQYADNATATTPLDFVKFNFFVRLWQKLGWTMDELDRALQLFFPATLPAWGDPTFDAAFTAAWKTALVYLAHLDDLNTRLAPALGRTALLPFWSNLPVQGENSLYSQLFLNPSVLNNDWAFDDPYGIFPTQLADFAPTPPFPPLTVFSAHQSTVQGVLGLTSDEIAAIFADAGSAVTTTSYVQNSQTITVPSFTLTNLSICYRYSALAKCLQLAVKDMIALKAMAASNIPPMPPVALNPFKTLTGAPLSILADDVLFNQTLLFVKEVAAVQNSGFTVEDLQYLLRQQFDPIGKYQTDPNALMALAQSVANGLQQIQTQSAVPANLASMAESLIDQILSTLVPAALLKALFSLLTNSQTYTGQATFVAAIDPTPFLRETELNFNFNSTTDLETLSFAGYLTDWKKKELEAINATIGSMLDMIQANAQSSLAGSVNDILGVWASMVQYEAVRTPVGAAIPSAQLMQIDPAISLSYDQTDKLEWVGYRGVLTDEKKAVLLAAVASTDLTALLGDIQAQALPAYQNLIGSIVAMWTNVQTYEATQTGVATANQIDAGAFFNALAAAQLAGTITSQVPQLQFSYNSGTQTQTLTSEGALTAAMQTQLGALIPSTVLVALLASLRTQVTSLFQTLSTSLLSGAAANLDTYVPPFVGLEVTKQQKLVKAALIKAFLPLLGQKLSQQLVVQTLAANLAADPSLVSTLVTDSALLSDPSNPGKPLLGAFLAIGQEGVSATYYDAGGNVLASGTAATVDTSDPTNSVPGAVKAHFEGYLQVPTDGPYRFFAELGDGGAAALFQMDAPDPAALLDNPIIPATPATATPSEISQYVQLSGGVLYHFTVDFFGLGAHGAKLLIQGENLSKRPLSQIAIYSEQAMVAFIRAKTLLANVLQILQTTGLDDREISYIVANSSEFNNIKLSSLPTLPSDDSPANAIVLFSQFLALADYADLRKGPAGGTDGLIDVFQGVGEAFTEAASSSGSNSNSATPWTALANLTRRNAATVRAIAEYFDFMQEIVLYQGQPGGFPGVDANSATWTDPTKLYWPKFTYTWSDGKVANYQANDAGIAVFTKSAGGETAYISVNDPTRAGQPPAGPAFADLNPATHYHQAGYVQIGTVTSNAFASGGAATRQLTAIGDFGNSKGLRRLWQALQLVQIVGIPVASLTASTVIASANPPANSPTPDIIAASFKNSVKAQYTADNWLPVAQSVFDKLRQKKRDALVAYLVQAMSLENSNQLFEYFLVDPGMEPVVQTSRLRLAMSSIQTFIQRCLLNLENDNSNAAVNVAPSSIDAEWWAWMKRYRVWQANREIFLYPENWMEPELRLDKTDLFENLESTLLQGNVTIDLANDAFYEYLQGLDLRARLDIVATYLDQDLNDASLSTLHVLGRTYGHPHKYFYRTYSSGVWSGWMAVTPEIDGDHIVLAIWKGRLNIFWVTFLPQQQPPQTGNTGLGNVAGLSFDALAGGITKAQAVPQVQVQLHWAEYFQDKWTNRISSDPNSNPAVLVNPGFDSSSAYIHVSKELDASGNEGAVRIHLDFPPVMGPRRFILNNPTVVTSFGVERLAINETSLVNPAFVGLSDQVQIGGGGYAFRVTSKNCAPDFSPQYWQAAAPNPYNANTVDATFYTGSASLSATFQTNIQNSGTGSADTETILSTVNNFSLLACANPVLPSPFLDATQEPLYAQAGALVSPFFFKDTSNPSASPTNFADELTFFVQPSLTETTIDQWQGWAIAPAPPLQTWTDPTVFNNIPVVAQVPVAGPVLINTGDPVYSIYSLQDTTDWLTNPSTAISYGGSIVGKTGGINVAALSSAASAISGVSAAALGSTFRAAGGLTIAGPQGLNLKQVQANKLALSLTIINATRTTF
jgi:hypothetical protein